MFKYDSGQTEGVAAWLQREQGLCRAVPKAARGKSWKLNPGFSFSAFKKEPKAPQTMVVPVSRKKSFRWVEHSSSPLAAPTDPGLDSIQGKDGRNFFYHLAIAAELGSPGLPNPGLGAGCKWNILCLFLCLKAQEH